MRTKLWALGIVPLLLLAACGDDDGGDGEAAGTTADAGTTVDADTATTTGGAAGADCPAEPFTGQISREVDDFSDQPAGAATDGELVDAVAYPVFGNYTVYVGDHEVDRDQLAAFSESISTDNAIVAPDGGLLATIFLFGEEEVAAGTELDLTQGSSVIVDAGGGASASTTGAAGTATIIAVDDSHLCFDIDYTDELQTVQGTVSAEIYQP